jgi:hypothetical protein
LFISAKDVTWAEKAPPFDGRDKLAERLEVEFGLFPPFIA